ncbi:MAG: hypothetical protein JW969_11535 [Spirochaetales bacterium]|nr:hypothetical protein [Spirochaetales bacterium]
MNDILRIYYFPTFWTVLIDIAAWFFIHMGVSYFMSLVPVAFFTGKSWLLREKRFERKGALYRDALGIGKWKRLLPDGAVIFKNGFPKRKLAGTSPPYLEEFVRETCRAEITHWIVFAFSPVFFLWNYFFVGLIMIFYAFCVNMPCIVTQRYNRIRMAAFIKRKSQKPAH